MGAAAAGGQAVVRLACGMRAVGSAGCIGGVLELQSAEFVGALNAGDEDIEELGMTPRSWVKQSVANGGTISRWQRLRGDRQGLL